MDDGVVLAMVDAKVCDWVASLAEKKAVRKASCGAGVKAAQRDLWTAIQRDR
jgi:hypothetical protein